MSSGSIKFIKNTLQMQSKKKKNFYDERFQLLS